MITQLNTLATQVLAADGETWFNNPVIRDSLWPATQETLLMTVFSSAFAVLLGLPLGICCLLYTSDAADDLLTV